MPVDTTPRRILQQKWVGFVSTGPRKIDVEPHSEWRDVPIEKEQKHD
jgi:hypothetical protein